ncbi:MAG: ATP-binding cassette domain-containing protein, partial [Undibacterium sp.]|nr:ATP-binding cassette domain-containing protein [Undibacterium sp.]
MNEFSLSLQNVSLKLGQSEIIRGIDLAVKQGEKLAIIGPNGAGKSSLFNLISGRKKLSGGSIYLEGEVISGLSPFQITRRGLARSFQISSIFSSMSVLDNLRCAVLWRLGYRYQFWRRLNQLTQVGAQAEQLLVSLDLQGKAEQLAAELCYAEQRKLELGMTIAVGAHCLLLDEPTSGMNPAESRSVIALLRTIGAGKTMLIVEHDMQVVFELA